MTVLFGELAVDLAERAEPESLHALIERFVLLAEEEVDRFGGTMLQLLGRGFMALFGAPNAAEDHPRRAALAALELRKRLGQSDLEGFALAARLAMSAGPVVIGGPSGATVGAAVDKAHGLVGRAEPGEVLAGAEMAALLVPEIELQALEPLEGDLTGHHELAWRVVAAASPYSPAAVTDEDRLSPFVGRAREMAVLEELREQAEAGQGQVVGMAGEAGSGKSRLLLELAQTMRRRHHSRLRGHCLVYTGGIPYFPFIDMVRRASRIDEGETAATVAGKLHRSLEAVGLEVGEHLPLFLHLLGLEHQDAGLDALDPRTLQARTFAAMRRMVLAASRRSLVVIEIEDLHWIDETSQEFLESLIEEIGGARVLLLLTYRSGYQPRWLGKSYASQVVMRRLSAADSETVVSAALRGREVGAETVRSIVERGEGNPFFLEELARALGEDDGASPEAPIPATVQGVLMARVDRLPEAEKHLIQLASVLGREPSVDLLERIWDRDEPLPPLLANLQRREFLYAVPEADQDAYVFKHALIQTVAYESLLKSRRRALHAEAAKALEELYAGRLEEAYDRLTYHYPRAGDAGKTVHYLSLFAARAAADYAHAEAAKALTEALEHAPELPAEVRDRRAVELLLQLAESLLPLARLPETLEVFERHREHVEGIEEPSLRARCHFWLAHTHTYLGNSAAAREHAEASIATAQEGGDEATEGKARYVLGRVAFWTGQGSAGLEQSLRAVVLLERSDEPWWQGQAYWVAGFHHFALGQLDQALEAFHRACAIGEALDDYRLDASWSIGHLHACQGRHEEAVEFCRRGVERSKDPLNTAVATGFLGFAYLSGGDARAAVDSLREAGARLAGTGMRQLQAWFAVFLAEALVALDRPEEAREAGAEGLEIARDAGFPYGTGLALRALGRIALASGDRERAAARLSEAEETFASIEAPFQLACTQLDRARLAHAADDVDGAAAALASADRVFDRLGLAPQRAETAALARELGLPSPLEAAS